MIKSDINNRIKELDTIKNLNLDFVSAIAQYEAELNSEIGIVLRKNAMKSGSWLWKAPYGYKMNENLKENKNV